MKKITVIALLILLILTGAVLYVSYSAANSLVHSPHEKAFDFPENYGYTNYESVSFPAGDDPNLILRAWYFPPVPEKNGATIIYVHGFQAERSWLLSQAHFMIDEGYGALMLDLRNSGESDGDTTYFGKKEWHDVEGVVDYLSTRLEVNVNLLGIMGRSMGGGVVIRAQAEMGVFKVRHRSKHVFKCSSTCKRCSSALYRSTVFSVCSDDRILWCTTNGNLCQCCQLHE